jgi:3-hydroxyisobutyrate dehydrogenase-like beta-hydroxyacid dehydrogenase
MNQIALLGTGLMGYPMAERLLGAGQRVRVYNRTREKAEPLEEKGAAVCDTPAEAIEGADCVILMLAAADAIRHLLFDSEPRPDLKGRTVIQMGTISPQQSRAVRDLVETREGEYLEAPVLGSPIQTRGGKLIVMVGGSGEQYRRWRPLLEHLGPEPLHVGEVGAAAALKLALNQLIAAHMAAFSLSYGFVEQEGVDLQVFLRVLRQSALYAPMFDNKLPRVEKRDFANPNFPVKHLLKDVTLFLEAAKDTSVDPAALEGVRAILQRAMAQGLGDLDYSALSEAVRNRVDAETETGETPKPLL